MSYILEALKKAERERRKDSVPDLQAHHTPYPAPGRNYSYPKKPVTLLVISLVVLIIAASVLIYLRREPLPAQQTAFSEPAPQTRQPDSRQMKKQEKPQETTVRQKSPYQQEVRQVQVEPQRVTVEPRPIIVEEETVITPPTPPSRRQEPHLPTYNDLAATIGDLPRLSLAGHTYSEDPVQRLIIINNRIVREGQGLGSGLRLEEITWDGLILSYKGTRFTMGATQ